MRDSKLNRPQWIKLWAEKYYDELYIDDLKELYPTQDEETEYLIQVGKAFVSALAYYNNYYSDKEFDIYQMDRDGKRLYKSLVRDIRQSYKAYEKRVEDGKKGGRPPKTDE